MTCLVAAQNPMVRQGEIVTCAVSIPDSYEFNAQDISLVGASAPMTGFKEMCRKYLEENSDGYHTAYIYFKREYIDTTKIIAISRLDW